MVTMKMYLTGVMGENFDRNARLFDLFIIAIFEVH